MFFNTHGEAFVNQYVTLVACNVINDKLTCLPIQLDASAKVVLLII